MPDCEWSSEEELIEKRGYPPSLAKACLDDFWYAAQLSTRQTFLFTKATPQPGGWVNLLVYYEGFVLPEKHPEGNTSSWRLDRGVDVRVSEIVWCADAPYGS